MDAVAVLPNPERVWKLDWLTPRRCRIILAIVLALGFFSHLVYLVRDCPIDLSGDEAHYWDWSRQLDWSYYSKGPMVAYIIRAGCAIFGDTMWAVRLPALVIAVGMSLITYGITKQLFGSEKLALGAVLLNHLVPMFIAGSLLMTIDPPLFLFWGLATMLAARLLRDASYFRWNWIGIGICVGLGFLAKYAMFLWFAGLFLFLIVDGPSRRWLKTPWPWMAMIVAAVFTAPVIIWNAQHEWVSLKHVATQTGVSASKGISPGNVLEFIGGQIGVVGPALFVIMVASVIDAIRSRQRAPRFLLCIGVPFFVIAMVTTLRTKAQINWPAPAYFTLEILCAWFLGTQMRSAATWKPWRGWFYATVVTALFVMPISHNPEMLYPVVGQFNRWNQDLRLSMKRTPSNWWARLAQHTIGAIGSGKLEIRYFDPTYKLRGYEELARFIETQRKTFSTDPMIVCEDYQVSAEMAFYLPEHPRTYYISSWFVNPAARQRFSQYDLWPDRQLDQPSLIGKDAIYIGTTEPREYAEIARAFASVEPKQSLAIYQNGQFIRRFTLLRCHGFKGMTRPDGGHY